jgi:hypothetical protein
MTRVLGAELLKLRTTRTAAALLAATLGLAMVFLLISTLTGHHRTPADGLDAIDVSPAALFVLIGAIVGVTGEYRHGTIASTFLAVPARRRQVLAQALAYVLVGAALVAVSWVAQLALGLPLLDGRGSPAPHGRDVASLIPREMLAAALLGGLGAGIGSLVANQPAALVGTLVAMLLVEPTLAALVSETEGYGPLGAVGSLAGNGGDTGPSAAVGGIVLAGWAAALLAAGVLATERRDVG